MGKKITFGLRNENILKAKLICDNTWLESPTKTCADCRHFGRDQKPIQDVGWDGKKRWPCSEKTFITEPTALDNDIHKHVTFVAADKPANQCPYFEEDNG